MKSSSSQKRDAGLKTWLGISGLALAFLAALWVGGLGCKQNVPPTTAFIVTPCPTPILFNSCQSLTANGNWNATAGITFTSILSLSPFYATGGQFSLDVNIVTPVAYNQNMLQLTGFTPAVWSNVSQLAMDVTVDPAVVAGASYSEFNLVASAGVSNEYFSAISTNTPTLSAGSQSVTWNIAFAPQIGTIHPTDSLSLLYFIYNRSNPSTGQGIGNIYVDNIRLVQNCP